MKYFVLASLLCLSACSDDNDNKNNETPQNLAELTVDASEISIAQGDTRTVKITSGNGEYEVTSANEEVVTAEVDGDIVTLTAVEGHNNAQGVVYVKDKYYQRAKILVNTAAEFDLKLNKTLFTLYSQVEGADEAFVKIYTGNGGYSLEVIDENNCIEVDQSTLEDSESFTVKGIAQGNAEVKITDRKGKEAFVNLNVIAPKQITTDADEKGVLINANQGSQQVKILSGNGEYKILDAGDTKVVRLELYGNVVTVTGRKAGETSFTLTDAKGQVSQPIQVKIAPDKRWCMNLGRDYAVWTHFGEMTGEGVEALKAATNDFKLKKMTWELTCRIDNTNVRPNKDDPNLPGDLEKNKYSYNSGQPLQAACLLYKITGEQKYLDEAYAIAESCHKKWFMPYRSKELNLTFNILAPGHAWFNTIMCRGFFELYSIDNDRKYIDDIEKSMIHAWSSSCHQGNNLLNDDDLRGGTTKTGWEILHQGALVELYARLAVLERENR